MRLLWLGVAWTLAGCAAGNGWVEHSYRVSPERAFRAAEAALSEWPVADRDADARSLTTDWVEDVGIPQTILGRYDRSTVERRRVRVRVEDAGSEGARIALHVDCERRAPAGRRGARWERVRPPEDLARGLFARIDASIAEVAPRPARPRGREAAL